jgi:hypothetical protein
MKYLDKCRGCNQQLYGPVKYCPFCGSDLTAKTTESEMPQQPQPTTVAEVVPGHRIEEPVEKQSEYEIVEEFAEDSEPLHAVEEPRPEQLEPEEEIPQDTKIDEDKGPKKPGEDYADTWAKNKFVRYVFVIIILAIGYFIYTNFHTTPTKPIKIGRGLSKTNSIPVNKKLLQSKASLPTSDDPSVKQAINDFVRNYLRDISNENLDALLTYYNDRVNYYAKGWVNKKFIYGDKKAYFKRWPHRTYELVSDIKISDSNEDSSKTVQFTYDFHVWNDNKTIRGQAENTFKLRFDNDMWRITDEKQNVISRESS